jgi:hypothetical protein
MSDIVWIDKHYKSYKMEDIKDSHLKNILGFMCRGGGFADFLSDSKIRNLFQEADNRGIKHSFKLKTALDEHNAKFLDSVLNEIMEDEFRWGSD